MDNRWKDLKSGARKAEGRRGNVRMHRTEYLSDEGLLHRAIIREDKTVGSQVRSGRRHVVRHAVHKRLRDVASAYVGAARSIFGWDSSSAAPLGAPGHVLPVSSGSDAPDI